MKQETFNIKTIQQDNVFINVSKEPMQALTGMPATSRFSHAIIAEGRVVNVVSNNYGLLKNENFFLKAEEALINADIKYDTRSINRMNESFAVDYILNDDSYIIKVKGSDDQIQPMLRYTNSYAGGPTTANFGFFRKICSNGLTICQTKIGFSVRHNSMVNEVVIPKIAETIEKFMDNEFYSLHKKFEVLAETSITDLEGFVKYVATKQDLFMYEMSEKNPEPSANARLVLDIIRNEAKALDMQPSLWLGYNAFNEFLHGKLKKSFADQQRLDSRLFSGIVEMAMPSN